MVRGILAIGSALGLTVVAEGVETSEQEGLLRRFGCDLVQGYLYSRPQTESDLLSYLVSSQPGPPNGVNTFSATAANTAAVALPVQGGRTDVRTTRLRQ